MFHNDTELLNEYEEVNEHYNEYLFKTQKAFDTIRANKVDPQSVQSSSTATSHMFLTQLTLAVTNNRHNIMRAERTIKNILNDIKLNAIAVLMDPEENKDTYRFQDKTEIIYAQDTGRWQ